MKHVIRSLAVFFLLSSCHPAQECPTIGPWRTAVETQTQKVVLDPDVMRIFSSRSTQKPPSRLAWSPDGKTIAMLEKSLESPDTTRLWLADVEKRRKRPLFLGEDTTVQDFGWLTADTLAVQTRDKIIRASLDGQVTETIPDSSDISRLTPSPDGQWLAYVRDNNLYAFSLRIQTEIPLSVNDAANVCSGCVSWLYEEEFRTQKGFEWSKDSTRLWFRQVDTGEMESATIATEQSDAMETVPYAHPGKNNPRVSIGVVSLNGDATKTVVLPPAGDNDWYLPDVMWHPNGATVLMTRMDRLQTHFELLQCSIGSEPPCESVYTQMDPRWINYPGLPVFTPDGTQYVMRLELDDFAQAYMFDATTHVYRPLTHGEFQVRQIATVDNAAVYFTAGTTDPLNVGIHRVAVADGVITPVNDSPGTHAPLFAPSRSEYPLMFVDTFSSVDVAPVVNLCDKSGTTVFRLDAFGEADYRPPVDVINEFGTLENADGVTLHVHITRPKVTGDLKYPAMVYVYGGPGYQAVANRYNTTFTAWRDMMAKRGFVIFTLDNRGSTGRGRSFETPIHRNLNAVALADQLDGVRWLKKQSYVDANRIGIIGWSFGGTLTLTALLSTENVFRLGVAIAPVTDWHRYDTAYTERYMQRPEDNAENYAATDLTRMTTGLTEKLLLVHGTSDRNVLPAHSFEFVRQCALNGRKIDTLFYPGEDHSIENRKMRAHLFSAITKFIESNL
ncbi:MAG: alpha/beta fold hydrolase [Deltaproteobacteria bacterium]|nr:alpha/beta fold hydrolase [Deltaproteobacteria bacterium]